MDTEKNLKDISLDLKTALDSMRARDEKLSETEKKYDTKLASLEAKSLELAEQLVEANTKLETEKKEREALEALYSKPAKGSVSEVNEYKRAINSYLRKGSELNEEMITKGVKDLYGDTLKNLDEKDAKKLAENVASECGDNKGYMLETKTLRTNVDTDGGLMVLPQRSSQRSMREFETSPLRQLAEVVTISTNEYEVVLDDDEAASGGWVGEEESRSNTDTPKLGLLTFPVHEQYANPKITQKMLDDAGFNVQSWLQAKTNDILTRTENSAFITGDGSKKPKGILAYDAWSVAGTYERNKVEQINSGVNGTFVADTIIDMQNSLLSTYQPGAVWGIKRESWAAIAKLKDGQGRYLLDMEAFKNGFQLQLLGKPVIFMSDLAAAATNSLSMVYGDFSKAYVIVDRIGIRVLRDPYTSKPYVQYYTTKRVGGGVKNFEAYKIYKLSA